MGLALHLPLRFEDKASITAMDSLQVGQKVNLISTVVGSEVQQHPRKQLRVWVKEGDTTLLLRWLHFYPGLRQKLSDGTRIQISGQIRQGYGTLEMVHPTVKMVPAGFNVEMPENIAEYAPAADAVLEPVYPSTGQLKQSDWHRWMKKLPAACFVDTLPASLCKKHKLLTWANTLHALHGQAKPNELYDLNLRTHPAWTRVKVDELLAQQLLLREYRQQRTQEKASPLRPAKSGLVKQFIAQLPFKLTGAQERSCQEIFDDLAQPYPMQRLLQGDVGSGKTIVAALAACQATSWA